MKSNYQSLLAPLLKSDGQFCLFTDPVAPRNIYLRHDIDADFDRAVLEPLSIHDPQYEDFQKQASKGRH